MHDLGDPCDTGYSNHPTTGPLKLSFGALPLCLDSFSHVPYALRARASELVSAGEYSSDQVLSGLAVPYGIVSHSLEISQPVMFNASAFVHSLASNDDIYLLHSNSTAHPLGRVQAHTLNLFNSPGGLHFECRPPLTSWWADLAESITRGDTGAIWISCTAVKAHVETRGSERIMVVDRADLHHLTLGACGPYNGALQLTGSKSADRSIAAAFDRLDALRGHGLSIAVRRTY